MGFLIIAIMCSSSVNLTFAYAKSKGLDTLNVTLFNYVNAFILSAFVVGSHADSFNLFAQILAEQPSLLVFALYTGIIYLTCFLCIQISVFKNGPSITTMFNRLGMVVPVAVSIFVFNEIPTAFRWVGIVLSILSLIFYSYDGGFQFNFFLFAVFALGGAAELSNKLFSSLFNEAFKGAYLLIVFGTCAVIMGFILNFRSNKVSVSSGEIKAGIFLGTVNFSTAFFILKALRTLPSTIVYPALSVGVILVTALISKLFFGELFTRKICFVLSLTVVSLIFINL